MLSEAFARPNMLMWIWKRAFSRIQQEHALNEQVHFRVIVEGRHRPLHPLIRDEVYNIGREAVVNAFRHAHAKRIEVEVTYEANSCAFWFRMTVAESMLKC